MPLTGTPPSPSTIGVFQTFTFSEGEVEGGFEPPSQFYNEKQQVAPQRAGRGLLANDLHG